MPPREPSTGRSLVSLMDIDEGSRDLWSPDEFGMVLEHQLDAPLAVELSTLEPGLTERLGAMQPNDGPPIRTFRDLLSHPHPPAELLELTKRFAKRSRQGAGASLPAEVASVVYFMAIAVATKRCHRQISGLAPELLQYGLDWIQKQPWLDEGTRRLLHEVC